MIFGGRLRMTCVLFSRGGLAWLDRGAGGEWSESGSSGYDSEGRNAPLYSFPAPENGLGSRPVAHPARHQTPALIHSIATRSTTLACSPRPPPTRSDNGAPQTGQRQRVLSRPGAGRAGRGRAAEGGGRCGCWGPARPRAGRPSGPSAPPSTSVSAHPPPNLRHGASYRHGAGPDGCAARARSGSIGARPSHGPVAARTARPSHGL